MKRPLVSILICTYNAEKTITSTLKSCLDQTYDNFEILIHDDQSKDKTIEVINNIGDRRIKIIKSGKKLGPYAGLNFLLDNAKGEYIAIQDHDDIWHPEKIEKQVKFLEDNKKYVGCGTSCLDYYADINSGYIIQEKEGDDHFVYHTSLMFRNKGYRYDISKQYVCDSYFMKYILGGNKKILHVLSGVCTLHYNKIDGNNLSNSWFKVNKKNIQTYFLVYGYDAFHVFAMFYILFLKILPKTIAKNINYFFLKEIKGLTLIENIADENIKCMISYLNRN